MAAAKAEHVYGILLLPVKHLRGIGTVYRFEPEQPVQIINRTEGDSGKNDDCQYSL